MHTIAPVPAAAAPPGPRWAGVLLDLRAAAGPWISARLVVGASLVTARLIAGWMRPLPEPVERHVGQGLLGWDAQRYLEIASGGYARLPQIELRFFPLLPLLIRWLDPLLPGDKGTALLLVVNIAALALGAMLHRIALTESGDPALARRVTWLAALMPAGFVYVWGYTEALWALLAAGSIYAARSGRWWIAAALAAGVGFVRPVGLVLVVPLAIEAVRHLRTGRRGWPRVTAALLAAPATTAAYLGWVWHRFGDPWLPYTIQQRGVFRGDPVDPVTALARPAGAFVSGQFTIDNPRLLWAVVLVALVVVCWKRWPPSYAAFATCLVLVALSSSRLGSFERYGFTAFPVVFALATVSARPWAERAALAVGTAAMSLYCLLALLGTYTP